MSNTIPLDVAAAAVALSIIGFTMIGYYLGIGAERGRWVRGGGKLYINRK